MLEKKISEDIKTALKSGDKVKLITLRQVISEIKNKKINDRIECLEDSEVIKIIGKLVKQHKESIDKFKAGNRMDLVEKEESELVILEAFLPEPMGEGEVKKIVDATIAELDADGLKDMGKVISSVIKKVDNRAEGSLVSSIVKDKLSGI